MTAGDAGYTNGSAMGGAANNVGLYPSTLNNASGELYNFGGGIKTSAAEGKTWLLQACAYVFLAKEAGYNISEVEFVRLKKEEV
jgi:hypothetical protein